MKTNTAITTPATAALSLPVWLLCLFLFLLWPANFRNMTAVAYAEEPIDIIVTGVEAEARNNVLEALALPPSLVTDGKTDRQWLERFARQAEAKVLAALEPFGLYNASVTIHVDNPEKDRYILRVNVTPGRPVILSDVHVEVTGPGAAEAPLLEFAAAFPLKKGDVLLHRPYEEARQNIQMKAHDLGYLDADYTIHEIRINADATSAIVTLVLDTKEKYYFSTITLEGAPDYPDAFLRRYVPIAQGDVFSNAKLAETQYLLSNSERFRLVTVDARKEEAQNHQVPIRILLTPAAGISLRPGIGYGTDTGARFALRYRDLNVFSRGHEFNSNLFISERLQGLAANYIFPDSANIRSYTSAQFNIQREDAETYINSYVALELARTISFSKARQASVYIRFQQESYTIGDQDDTSRYVLPGIRFSDNYYDNLLRPTRGFRYALDLRGTNTALGSTTQLLQLIAEASHVLTLPWRLSLLTGAKTGITFFSDPLDDLPPSLRFFAGGDQSVRGYAYQSLGPCDSSGEVVGGKHMFAGHIDLQRAILEDWAVSLFYNAGNAFNSATDITLYQAVGAGIHYFTPVGALNLFVARQIAKDDPQFRIHFTVGFEF